MGGVRRSKGHYINDEGSRHCAEHGAPLVQRCACGVEFEIREDELGREFAPPFCSRCGSPAPWASREDLYRWARDLVNDDDISAEERVKLQNVIQNAASITDENKVAAAWDYVKRAAPKAFAKIRPFLPLLTNDKIAELLMRALR